MKLLTIIALVLPFTVKSQLVTCPLTTTFQRDTIQETWGLVSSGVTEWQLISNLSPNSKSKEGYTYLPWLPMGFNPRPVSPNELDLNSLAYQMRVNEFTGTVECQIYFCVYSFRNKKNQ